MIIVSPSPTFDPLPLVLLEAVSPPEFPLDFDDVSGVAIPLLSLLSATPPAIPAPLKSTAPKTNSMIFALVFILPSS